MQLFAHFVFLNFNDDLVQSENARLDFASLNGVRIQKWHYFVGCAQFQGKVRSLENFIVALVDFLENLVHDFNLRGLKQKLRSLLIVFDRRRVNDGRGWSCLAPFYRTLSTHDEPLVLCEFKFKLCFSASSAFVQQKLKLWRHFDFWNDLLEAHECFLVDLGHVFF